MRPRAFICFSVFGTPEKTLALVFDISLLKLVNNLSSQTNEIHVSVWIFDFNKHRFPPFYFSVFSLVSIEKIHQARKSVFDEGNIPVRVTLSTLFSLFNVVKHGLSCLILH